MSPLQILRVVLDGVLDWRIDMSDTYAWPEVEWYDRGRAFARRLLRVRD